MKRLAFLSLFLLVAVGTVFVVAQEKAPKKKNKKGYPKKELYSGAPIKALIITGGCCHNYLFQTYALGSGVQKLANVQFEIVNVGGTGTSAQIPLYNDPDWAEPYDVVIHNECFAKTTNPEYIRKITGGHLKTPAVVIHCAMHSYRDAEVDDWRAFLGVTSKRHDHQSRYAVKVTAPDHPVMEGFPENWVTPMDELYIIEKLWPTATALGTSVSEKDGKEHPVIWVNDYNGVRVAGTTYGHTDDAFRDPVFIRLLANSIVWAAGKE